MEPQKIAIFGASGAIGQALARYASHSFPEAQVHTFSRSEVQFESSNITHHLINYESEEELRSSAQLADSSSGWDLVWVTNGILHQDGTWPEKSLRDLDLEKFQKVFSTNCFVPLLIAKYFVPKLTRQRRSIFCALSARVGSISDNRLGGWYSYRASKAALNMLLKTASIESRRRNRQSIVVTMHPGTVDSDLSKPFQKGLPEGQLLTPDFSASRMMEVLAKLEPDDNGKCFAWDGKEIEP